MSGTVTETKVLDNKGVQLQPLIVEGLTYKGEPDYEPKENFRPDGSFRLDFPKVVPMARIRGYVKLDPKTPKKEELAGKLEGTHSSNKKYKNSGSYVVGIRSDGTAMRIRKEIHPKYSLALATIKLELGDLRGKFVGYDFAKVNLGSKVVIIVHVDTDPFDDQGVPTNNWVHLGNFVDDGNWPSSKKGKLKVEELNTVWLEPSEKGKGQYTLRADSQKKETFEYKLVSFIEIEGQVEEPDPEPCEPHQHRDPATGKCVDNETDPEPDPTAKFDANGLKLLKPVTGNWKPMLVGGDPAGNGQRYSGNHPYSNYMQIGLYKTAPNQEVLEMKTDGYNHGSCKQEPQCTWIEANVSLIDRSNKDKTGHTAHYKAGQFYLASEHPHPENYNVRAVLESAKIIKEELRNRWLGYAVLAWQEGQFRHIQAHICLNPFLPDGKVNPEQKWIMGIDEVDAGQITTPELAKRLVIDPNFDPKGKNPPRGLEAEIRMHGDTKGHGKEGGTDMKFGRIYELVTPVQ